MVEIDAPSTLESFRRFIIASTCSSFAPRSYLEDPEVFAEREDSLGSIYVESADKVTLKKIREITFVNAKDVAGGGTTSSPAKASGWNTSNSTFTAGFTGYSFNGGSGYANTIYAHCNFLAGKKIKLLEKIMKAIEDVDELYKQIEGKRAEYYEYNASGE